jgi:hypothetical protein
MGALGPVSAELKAVKAVASGRPGLAESCFKAFEFQSLRIERGFISRCLVGVRILAGIPYIVVGLGQFVAQLLGFRDTRGGIRQNSGHSVFLK